MRDRRGNGLSLEEPKQAARNGTVLSGFYSEVHFPGGCLPPRKAIEDGVAAAGLELISMETFAESYALTLAEMAPSVSFGIAAN
jgi:cyclopropane fatty-acyl-phospholipid synthase-like methyltransferase